jgi:hypothetical protein
MRWAVKERSGKSNAVTPEFVTAEHEMSGGEQEVKLLLLSFF